MGALEEQPAVLNPRDTSLGPKNILSLSTTTRHVTPIKHFEGTLSSQGESLTPSDNPFQNQDLSFYPSSLPSPLPVPHYNWIYFGFSETSPGIAEIRQSLTLSGFLPRPSSILTPPPIPCQRFRGSETLFGPLYIIRMDLIMPITTLHREVIIL